MLLALRSDLKPTSEYEADAKAMELAHWASSPFAIDCLPLKACLKSPSWAGILKQYQVLTSHTRLAERNVTLTQLTEATAKANVLAGGGVMNRGEKESLLRIQGQSLTLDEVAATPILWRDQVPIRIAT